MTTTSCADVVVVGLGAVGSAVAHYLAAGGATVLGLDRYLPPHDRGSSHGDTRITRLAIGEGDDYVPIVRRSHTLWRELEHECGDELMRTTGGLVIASFASDRHAHHGQAGFFGKTVSAAQRFGIAHEMLGADEIRRRFPMFLATAEERGYFERDAGLLRPEACVQAHLDVAAARGADLRYGTAVDRIEQVPGGTGATLWTNAGRFSAAHVVIATGAWLPAMLSPESARRFAVQRQVLHWFETDRRALYDPSLCPVFVWMHGSAGETFYGFPKIGSHDGVKVATEQSEHTTSPDTVERTVGEEESSRMHELHVRGRLLAVTPRVVHASTCLYTSAADGRFIIDRHPAFEQVTVVSACSGHGFKHSAAVGEAIADALLGRRVRVDLRPFATLRAE